MTKEYGVIKIYDNNDNTGYTDVYFFKGIETNLVGDINILKTDDPCNAMLFRPIPFDTVGGAKIKKLVDYINETTFNNIHAEFKTFKINL